MKNLLKRFSPLI